MRCPICGAEIADSAEFCPKCQNRMPGQAPNQPGLAWGAALIGLLAGFATGILLVFITLEWWPGPPFILAAFLVYGLGLAVLLICILGKGLFPKGTRPHLTPFSIAFTAAYYFASIGYLMWLVG